MAPKRFASWAAVSSEEQAEKISLPDQLRTNRAHIERSGGQLVEELVVDESRSIVLLEDACRAIPAYARLKELIDLRAFDVLIYLNPTRLGREASLVMAVFRLCELAGIVLYETDSPPPTLDSARRGMDKQLIDAFRAVGAQHEVRELVERNRKGMQFRGERGYFPNNINYGWARTFDAAGKIEYHVVEAEAAAVHLIAALYLENGLGTKTIAEQLDARSFPTPTGVPQWGKQTVQMLLRRSWLYAGYVEINRNSKTGRPFGRFAGKFPAILTETLAQDIQTEMRRRASATRSVESPRLFSQCVHCGMCNLRMPSHHSYSQYRNASGEEIRYPRFLYRCPSDTRHAAKSIGERKIFALVEAAIYAWQSEDVRAEILASRPHPTQHARDELARLDNQRRQIEKQQDNLDDAMRTGLMTHERWQRQMERINAQFQTIGAEIAAWQRRLEDEQVDSRFATRLEDTALSGLAMLAHEHIPTAWASRAALAKWLRPLRRTSAR